MNLRKSTFPIMIFAYAGSIIYLSYYSVQDSLVSILVPGFIACLSFYILYSRQLQEPTTFRFIQFIILIKLTLIFAIPNLSNDFYRFWWDGYLSSHGINPYLWTPTEILIQYHSQHLGDALQAQYNQLNSPEYHTVYPLLSQLIFCISAKIAGTHLHIFSIILKLFVLLADLGILFFSIKILRQLKRPLKYILLFFGNPLCIMELNNNLHFEVFLILFLALSIYYTLHSKVFLSGLSIGFSFISKLTSLLLLPLFIQWPFFKKYNILIIIGFLFPTLLFIAYLIPGLYGYQKSMGLYFHQFEFNSLLYGPISNYFDIHKWYLLKPKIGIYLMSIFLLIYSIILIYNWVSNKSYFSFKHAWLILFFYLIFSSTVHPWYITPILFLSCFVFPLSSFTWSFLILFSYARYDSYFINYEPILLYLEYAMVLILLIYELHKQQHKNLQNEFDIKNTAHLQ
ncbi:MAG: hypothetical protein WBB02_00905 [Saprospiraceae bacterium]